MPLLFLVLQVLEYEQQYLAALPLPEMYEKSYMHRDTGTAPVCCSTFRTCLPSLPLWSAAGMPLAVPCRCRSCADRSADCALSCCGGGCPAESFAARASHYMCPLLM